jgi:hypothetical protein
MTQSQVDTDSAARKRQEIGLSPRRTTASAVVARPPVTRGAGRIQPWLWFGLVALIALCTVALIVMRLTSSATPSLASLEARFAGQGHAGALRNDFSTDEGPLIRDFQPEKWSMGTLPDEGVYRIRLLPSVIAWSTLGAGRLENFRFASRIQVSESTPWGYGGILGRYTNDQNLYLVEVDGGGRYRFQVQDGGEWTTLQDWTKSDLLLPAGEWNELAVLDSGGTVSVEANGKELFSTQAVWLPAGDTGVVAGSLQPAVAEANFDWIALERTIGNSQ